MTIIRYSVYELWDGGNIVMSLRIEKRPEFGGGYGLLDHSDGMVISVHDNFADAVGAATLKLVERQKQPS